MQCKTWKVVTQLVFTVQNHPQLWWKSELCKGVSFANLTTRCRENFPLVGIQNDGKWDVVGCGWEWIALLMFRLSGFSRSGDIASPRPTTLTISNFDLFFCVDISVDWLASYKTSATHLPLLCKIPPVVPNRKIQSLQDPSTCCVEPSVSCGCPIVPNRKIQIAKSKS